MNRPIRMIPTVRHYLWGGEKLRSWGKDGETPLAESWELSARADGMSFSDDGRSLAEIFSHDFPGRDFPVLVKLIDAAKDLSVQVHPDDRAARAEGFPYGKSECWFVLSAEPGSRLAIGLEKDMDRAELREAALDGSLPRYLHWITPKEGECYAIEAGQIHALGAGIMVAEVQQNSDTTYRLYDYGRLDRDGNPRPLHLDKALQVADLTAWTHLPTVLRKNGTWTLLCDMPSFSLFGGSDPMEFPDRSEFSAVIALEDMRFECRNESFSLPRGQTAYLPPHTPLSMKERGLCLLILPKKEGTDA